jgi:hypothetical protein
MTRPKLRGGVPLLTAGNQKGLIVIRDGFVG